MLIHTCHMIAFSLSCQRSMCLTDENYADNMRIICIISELY